MNTAMKSLQKGFTLIELLVVLAIIGVLTSFLLANFIGAKARARDAQRKSDLRQIQSAFELFRTDTAAYPTNGQVPGCGGILQNGGTTYIQKYPCDPLTNTAYKYVPAAAGYTLTACLENKNDSQAIADGTCSSGKGFRVTNP